MRLKGSGFEAHTSCSEHNTSPSSVSTISFFFDSSLQHTFHALCFNLNVLPFELPAPHVKTSPSLVTNAEFVELHDMLCAPDSTATLTTRGVRTCVRARRAS